MPADIKKEVIGAQGAEIFLVLYTTDNYIDAYVSVLDDAVNSKKQSVIFITVNKPYRVVVNNLIDKKIPIENVYFIDCISKKIVQEAESAKNCIFADSPNSLTEIIIILNQLLKRLEAKKIIIILDSVNTLLLYNEKKPVLQFTHFLVNKTRLVNAGAVFLSLKKDTDQDLLAQMTQFFDKVIDLGDKNG